MRRKITDGLVTHIIQSDYESTHVCGLLFPPWGKSLHARWTNSGRRLDCSIESSMARDVYISTYIVFMKFNKIKSIKLHGDKFSKISWEKYLSHEIKSIYFHNFNPTWGLISVKFHIGTTPLPECSAELEGPLRTRR